ncbi:hypothetical protein KRR26_28910 [Corallococcus sp. M34]|uniref:hypothetical protein n=1 Tax=Citreicoccus inhibens TaxID=2849499 RepID=UPI001C23A587|nr:hypothetical protein [Citreicoccus inhibens]MBU8899638.1 hypothetical protein [Citreicoccus inhibens]
MRAKNLGYALLTLALGGTAHALEPMVPYDNFNPMRPSTGRTVKIRGLDPARWANEQTGTRVESVRELAFTRLHLKSRATAGAGRYGLAFTNPARVTAIEAKVRLNNARSLGCLAPQAGTATSMAELSGTFFNAGTVTAGSAKDDVTAAIHVVSRSTDIPGSQELRVEATVAQCLDAACATRSALFTQDLGMVHQGEQTRLRMQWDAANHRFIFQRDEQAEVYGAYAVADVQTPSQQGKGLRVTHELPTCPASDPAPLGYANAYFHDVLVNKSAAP